MQRHHLAAVGVGDLAQLDGRHRAMVAPQLGAEDGCRIARRPLAE
jgi:hypothetical protein